MDKEISRLCMQDLKPQPRIEMKDIYWLAGLLEGEGCFSKQSSPGSLVVRLAMTDKDIIDRASLILRTSTHIAVRKTVTNKEVFYCAVFGFKAVQWMMTLYSLMGNRRQEKIKNLLDGWKTTAVPGSKNSQSQEYQKAYSKQYYLKNKERVNAKHRKDYAKRRDNRRICSESLI